MLCMSKFNFAAIDIGSNAVRLMIKGINEGETIDSLTKVFLVRVPLRLGQDTFTLGRISNDKTGKLLRLVKAFRQLMQVYNVISYRACATSAMRDAANGPEVAKYITEKTGVEIEIVTGLEEARIVYDSHIVDVLDRPGNYIYVDVGGGSTEVSLISDRRLRNSHSYNIGTVRILNNKVDKEELLRLYDDLRLLGQMYPDISIIGSGGNINKIFKLSGTPKGNLLTTAALREVLDRLSPLSVKERMEKFDLKPDRADVIVPAAELFLQIANHMKTGGIWVPTIGIVDGITYALCEQFLSAKL
ncbi:Ppx/GppA phosphatase family protein [Coprobacter tertius]|uniref:Ppx/GppA family phosphatase n=1 Tax=Coprobacter tertius TaxID=2944915 RepID=A0ABT1MK22_9BACT|nr:Ppx/GppA family phosphatase [Coprobacter tertius]MCP9612719.1 Ppx/GppA family phosphatase [Coprobacter tertius]